LERKRRRVFVTAVLGIDRLKPSWLERKRRRVSTTVV
jgi:hypothetical protein